MGRQWKVGLAIIVGAALICVRGGLAAPFLAAGIGMVVCRFRSFSFLFCYGYFAHNCRFLSGRKSDSQHVSRLWVKFPGGDGLTFRLPQMGGPGLIIPLIGGYLDAFAHTLSLLFPPCSEWAVNSETRATISPDPGDVICGSIKRPTEQC